MLPSPLLLASKTAPSGNRRPPPGIVRRRPGGGPQRRRAREGLVEAVQAQRPAQVQVRADVQTDEVPNVRPVAAEVRVHASSLRENRATRETRPKTPPHDGGKQQAEPTRRSKRRRRHPTSRTTPMR